MGEPYDPILRTNLAVPIPTDQIKSRMNSLEEHAPIVNKRVSALLRT
jgi:hypothetical protein